ncbi:germination protein YpeB [Clostridiaceae bacterium UIB06]|uniref:Germination protein YpeB n=1 Tax=Clostridium thailandense TaxID=2794346 RepID=A0A949TGH1_9CLOT|nr:germination protein YpeB [Clostridium thailandense]MBV7272364.1 germination protein YpeB [Clostridium thailandense]MCH5135923.1 germination protein YpeB [Clostridiaceae bacterium UIB06]
MKVIKKRIIYTTIVTLIVVFSSTFAILMTLERTDYRNYLQAQYSKSMYELIDSVQNIRVNLGKSSIVGSREQEMAVFSEIFRYAAMANDKIHSLPVSQEVIGDTSKFLSQVGDFCYTLEKASSEGRQLSDADYATVDNLKNQSFSLEQQLKKVSSDINEGRVRWGEIRKKITGVFASGNKEEMLGDKFGAIQKQVTQYPSLIYDGPFSDNSVQITPRINSQKEITQNQAEDVVRTLIGKDKVESLQSLTVEGSGRRMDVYRFSVSIRGRASKDEKVVCEITKKGGKVLYLLDGKSIGKASIDVGKATNIGSNYLKNIGYSNMVPTYTLNYGNVAVINYVYMNQNIIIYPDQIKLKIALDDGNIVGIESEKYLVSHQENRSIPSTKFTAEQAKQKVGKKLNITSVRLAVIPTETNKEVLCYEFSGNYKGDNYKVYVNAQTNYEQRILQIINTPNGQLTM